MIDIGYSTDIHVPNKQCGMVNERHAQQYESCMSSSMHMSRRGGSQAKHRAAALLFIELSFSHLVNIFLQSANYKVRCPTGLTAD